MIKSWIKMKKKEILVKNLFYDAIINFLAENENIALFAKKLYISLKDVPLENMRETFFHELAELVHFEAQKQRESVE